MNNGETNPLPSLRLHPIVGAVVCFTTAGCILGILAWLFRRDPYSGMSRVLSLSYYGALATFLVAFSLRALNWSGNRAFLLALLPLGLLSGAILCVAFELGIPARDPAVYVLCLCAWAIAAIPWAIGVLVAALIPRLVRTPRNRRRAFSVVVILSTLGLSLPMVKEKGVVWYTSSHAAIAGPPALQCNAKDLYHTIVTPTLDAPITEGTNVLWCATLQIAWSELADLCGGSVDMVNAPAVADVLNNKDVSTNDLDASSFVAVAGPGNSVVPQIQAELASKFHGQASPVLLRPVKDGILAYAYLFINLPFEWAFERLPFPMLFGTNSVECFGTVNLHNPRQDRAGRQLIVRDYRSPDDLVIELQTRRGDHELILAMVPHAGTLGQTIRGVGERLQSSSGKRDTGWLLQIPVLNFDVTRAYEEICGREVRGHGRSQFAMPLAECIQQIRFRLDERGAVLKSEVAMALGGPPSIRFDKPFLVLLRLRGRDKPYFALWVDNAELLVPSRKPVDGRRRHH